MNAFFAILYIPCDTTALPDMGTFHYDTKENDRLDMLEEFLYTHFGMTPVRPETWRQEIQVNHYTALNNEEGKLYQLIPSKSFNGYTFYDL